MIDAAADAIVVGAGAAGLATAIFARRENPHTRVVVLDGARKPGAKILVSGGSRCNVTNTVVTEADFQGGRSAIVRRILRGFPVPDTVEFFKAIGVPLHEEPGGKLFPDSNNSRDVLAALLRELARSGGELFAEHRVLAIEREPHQFLVSTPHARFRSTIVALATGGLSLPKTGSDGAGYGFARAFGHSIVPLTPALVPLLLDGSAPGGFHAELAGVSHEAALDIRANGARIATIDGSLLWTHFGISGPAALDASRFWLRARLDGLQPLMTARLCAGLTFEQVEAQLTEHAVSRPRASIHAVLSRLLPAAVAAAVLRRLSLDGSIRLAQLTRTDRRRIVRALTEWPLPVVDSRGYNYAEVTAGGIPLTECDPATMESRVCPRLFLTGEILDVDGRIGGFNFQWAWSTARIAGRAIGRRLAR